MRADIAARVARPSARGPSPRLAVVTNPAPGDGLTGDVHPSAAAPAATLTPVPGGVGPATTALLLRHTIDAYEQT
jgi:methylenetetrahydrofolate dehydrogenase (NADP+)/methenyltetrahydrofolate cyclohydrolase